MATNPFGAGTAAWALNRFRDALLAELIKDLRGQRDVGLTEEECRRLTGCLSGLVDICAKADETFLKARLQGWLSKFRDEYTSWNSPPPTTDPRAHRDAMVSRLAHVRRHLTRGVRKRQKQLALLSPVDEQVAADLLKGLDEITKSYPKKFPRLTTVSIRIRVAARRARL